VRKDFFAHDDPEQLAMDIARPFGLGLGEVYEIASELKRIQEERLAVEVAGDWGGWVFEGGLHHIAGDSVFSLLHARHPHLGDIVLRYRAVARSSGTSWEDFVDASFLKTSGAVVDSVLTHLYAALSDGGDAVGWVTTCSELTAAERKWLPPLDTSGALGLQALTESLREAAVAPPCLDSLMKIAHNIDVLQQLSPSETLSQGYYLRGFQPGVEPTINHRIVDVQNGLLHPRNREMRGTRYNSASLPGEESHPLVQTVLRSVEDGANFASGISNDVMNNIEGYASGHIRHFFSSLGSRIENIHYLEVGTFKGSTLISLLAGNEASISRAVAIDSFVEFVDASDPKGNKNNLLGNLAQYVDSSFADDPSKFMFLETDCWDSSFVSSALGKLRFNVYFYDGPHSKEDHTRAFTHYSTYLEDEVLVIIDDFNQRQVREGTREGILRGGEWEIVFEMVVDSRWNGDSGGWWDGEGIFLLRRRARANHSSADDGDDEGDDEDDDDDRLILRNLKIMEVENVSPAVTRQRTVNQPNVNIVSFPRSGHTLITKILRATFERHEGVDFNYCESYINNEENVSNCGSVVPPNIKKSHDFDLTVRVEPDEKYVVLFRKELQYQLEAVFRWLCTKQAGCPKSMRSFMDNWSTYYFLFKNKWLDKTYYDGRRVAALEYYTFLRDPLSSVRSILEHLDYTYEDTREPFEWDPAVIREVVESFQVKLQQNEAEIYNSLMKNARLYEEEGGTRLLNDNVGTPLWEGFYEQ